VGQPIVVVVPVYVVVVVVGGAGGGGGGGVVDCGLGCVVCGPVLSAGCTGVVVVVEIRTHAK
jgi:hypothetical protein